MYKIYGIQVYVFLEFVYTWAEVYYPYNIWVASKTGCSVIKYMCAVWLANIFTLV